MNKPLSFWTQIALCTAVLAVLFLLVSAGDIITRISGSEAKGIESAQQSRARSSVPVIVSPVLSIQDALLFETVGTGVASRSVMLRSEVEGTVKTSRLSSGKRFAEGELLLTLENQDQQLALRLSETRYRQAERDKERLSDLLQRGITPETVYQEAVTEAELALLEFERAKVALEDREIRAPFEGVAGLPAVEPGDRVEAGAELASFDDREKLMVEFDLPETLLTRISEGKMVKATTASVPGTIFEGKVVSIDSRIDPRKRTARVRVEILNKSDLLRPGASFALSLNLTGGLHPAVPELALQFARGSLYVWRVKKETSERVEVTLVRRQSGDVLVDGPLNEGDLVIIEGTQRLSPGRNIKILGSRQTAD